MKIKSTYRSYFGDYNVSSITDDGTYIYARSIPGIKRLTADCTFYDEFRDEVFADHGGNGDARDGIVCLGNYVYITYSNDSTYTYPCIRKLLKSNGATPVTMTHDSYWTGTLAGYSWELITDGTYLYHLVDVSGPPYKSRIYKIDPVTMTTDSYWESPETKYSDVKSLCYTGGYLYISCYNRYATDYLVKISSSTMTTISEISTIAEPWSICTDNTDLFISAGSYSAEKLVRVSLSSFTVTQTTSCAMGTQHMIYYNGHIYDSTSRKVDATTFTVEDTYDGLDLNYYGTSYAGCHVFGGKIYIGMEDPCFVVRLDPATFERDAYWEGKFQEHQYDTRVVLLGNYAYIGSFDNSTQCPIILKFQKSSMSLYDIWTGDYGGWEYFWGEYPMDIDTDGTYLYATTWGDPTRVYKFNVDTMELMSITNLGAAYDKSYHCRCDSTHMYVSCKKSDTYACVLKIQVSDMSTVGEFALGSASSTVYQFDMDDNYLYVPIYISPSYYIYKISKSSMTTVSTWTQTDGVVQDGCVLYDEKIYAVGSKSSPNSCYVYKLDPTTMTKDSSNSFTDFYYGYYYAAYDDKLYIGGQDPDYYGSIIVINIADLTKYDKILAYDTAENSTEFVGLAVDETGLYAAETYGDVYSYVHKITDLTTKVISSIRHIYKPGVYKMELGFGRLEGQPDYTNNIDKMKVASKEEAVQLAVDELRKTSDATYKPPAKVTVEEAIKEPGKVPGWTQPPAPKYSFEFNPQILQIAKDIRAATPKDKYTLQEFLTKYKDRIEPSQPTTPTLRPVETKPVEPIKGSFWDLFRRKK